MGKREINQWRDSRRLPRHAYVTSPRSGNRFHNFRSTSRISQLLLAGDFANGELPIFSKSNSQGQGLNFNVTFPLSWDPIDRSYQNMGFLWNYLLLGHLLSGSILNHLMHSKDAECILMCNAKRFVCCTYLCTKTTITSSVNGRQLSIINNTDMDHQIWFKL